MQAILELQRQLREVQSTKSNASQRLNERNIVDIIKCILDANKIKLIYTSDGKEYLTNEQLEKEIKELLTEQGGRINILEIPNHLGVNIDVVERCMDTFVKKNRVALINGQLISDIYVDQMMEELYELVNERGQVMLSELTGKFNLPLDYIKDCVMTKMESSLPQGCRLEGNSLMTKTYAQRVTCKIRGILRGVTRPVALSAIAAQYRIEEQKFKNVTDTLLKEGQIKGKIQSGLFIPLAFSQMQEGAIITFYKQNKYLEYQMLTKLQISKPKEFIEQVLGKDQGQHLVNFFISKDHINQAEAHVQDIIERSSFLDLSSIIPSPFREEDTAKFIQIISHECKLLSDNQHLVSQKFLSKCMDEFKVMSEQLAIEKIKKGIKPGSEESKKSLNQSQTSKSSTSKKGKGGGKKKKGRQDDSEEEKEVTVEDQITISISEADIKATLMKSQIPEFKEHKEEAELMLDTLIEALLYPVNKQFQEIFVEVFARNSTKSQASQNKNVEQEVEENFQNLQFIYKQVENIKKIMENNGKAAEFQEIMTPIKVHLFKNEIQHLLNKLCTVQAFHNNVNLQSLAISKDPKTQQPVILNANDRKLVAKQFQKHITAIFEELGSYVQEKRLDEFVSTLSNNIKNLGARISKVDKKIEKKLKEALISQLKAEFTEDKILNPLMDFRQVLTAILNWRMLENNCYVGLPNEEWCCKIMLNLIINHGIESNLEEKRKDDLIKAGQVYSMYASAAKGGDEGQLLKDQFEINQQLLLELTKVE